MQNSKPYKELPKVSIQPKKPSLLKRFVNWYTQNKKRIEENRKNYEAQIQQRRQEQNENQSVYSDDPEDTQEDDMARALFQPESKALRVLRRKVYCRHTTPRGTGIIPQDVL